MIEKYKYKNIDWIDLENPTQDEIRSLINEYSIEPLVADELISPTLRSRVDMYPDYIYMILHFPIADSPNSKIIDTKSVQEIDMIIGKDFIITTRYETIDALHEFSKVFEVNSILDKSDMGKHAGFIFFYMIQYFYKGMMDKIENVREILGEIEEEIFKGNEKQMVIELSKANRLLLTFQESIALHEEVLQSFEIAGQQFFGKDFKYHLRKVIGEYYRVRSALGSTRDYLHELRDTNDSLLSSKQNEIMKTLTVMAFVVLPLSFLTGLFGMNTKHIPFIGEPYDFMLIMAIMFIVGMSMYIFVKVKRWL